MGIVARRQLLQEEEFEATFQGRIVTREPEDMRDASCNRLYFGNFIALLVATGLRSIWR